MVWLTVPSASRPPSGVAAAGPVGLEDLGVDAGVPERHGGDRAGDAAPGDQGLDHCCCPL
jgi:hypothetical protein